MPKAKKTDSSAKPESAAKKSTPSAPAAPTTAEAFEKLGVFYMGRPYDLAAKQARPGWLLYDSKDLVTHAVCVGMTGSGKTGLCLALLEEAAIDNIPAIIIDPKGDLTNLFLTLGPVAVQGYFAAYGRRPGARSLDNPSISRVIDSCHVWRKDGPYVKSLAAATAWEKKGA